MATGTINGGLSLSGLRSLAYQAGDRNLKATSEGFSIGNKQLGGIRRVLQRLGAWFGFKGAGFAQQQAASRFRSLVRERFSPVVIQRALRKGEMNVSALTGKQIEHMLDRLDTETGNAESLNESQRDELLSMLRQDPDEHGFTSPLHAKLLGMLSRSGIGAPAAYLLSVEGGRFRKNWESMVKLMIPKNGARFDPKNKQAVVENAVRACVALSDSELKSTQFHQILQATRRQASELLTSLGTSSHSYRGFAGFSINSAAAAGRLHALFGGSVLGKQGEVLTKLLEHSVEEVFEKNGDSQQNQSLSSKSLLRGLADSRDKRDGVRSALSEAQERAKNSIKNENQKRRPNNSYKTVLSQKVSLLSLSVAGLNALPRILERYPTIREHVLLPEANSRRPPQSAQSMPGAKQKIDQMVSEATRREAPPETERLKMDSRAVLAAFSGKPEVSADYPSEDINWGKGAGKKPAGKNKAEKTANQAVSASQKTARVQTQARI